MYKAALTQPHTVFATQLSCTDLLAHAKLSCAQRGHLLWQDHVTVGGACVAARVRIVGQAGQEYAWSVEVVKECS